MEKDFIRTLADMRPGDRAMIRRIHAQDPRVQRLMILGLVEGAEVVFLCSALGGDPLEFQLFGSKLSLRTEQARHFEVAAVTADGR